jgi:WD40 repeat protein
LVRHIAREIRKLQRVALSPDARMLAVLADNRMVTIWDLGTGGLLATITNPSPAVASLLFAPDSRTVVVGGDDGLIRLFEASTGIPGLVLAGHAAEPRHLAAAPDGLTLGSLSVDGVVKLWQLATGRELATLWRGHIGRGIVFAPDNRRLYVPLWAPKTLVWNAPRETSRPPAASPPGSATPASGR